MKIIWKSSPVCRGLQNSKLLKGLTADSDKLSSLLYSSCFTLSHSIKSLSMLWSHPRRNNSPCNQVVARLPKSSVIQLSSSITKLPSVKFLQRNAIRCDNIFSSLNILLWSTNHHFLFSGSFCVTEHCCYTSQQVRVQECCKINPTEWFFGG